MARKKRGFGELAHSWKPFGMGEIKPHHFRDMTKVAWRNRDNLRYAWRVLSRGVCDGCALGTSGLRDWTMRGPHLCMVRLELLRLNTMPELDQERLSDVSKLMDMSSAELRELGRLGWPMRRRKGELGFTPVGWDELWAEIGVKWRDFDPHRVAMYLTSRGITNEVYYTAQKVMRYLGSPNVENSARLCHSPSTAGLKSTIGVAATTCSYRDWYDADLIVFFGSNPANDQPVATKYLAKARRKGARVLTVNAYREPGMERYWVPSSPASALFGTKLSDTNYLVKVGGDLAFLCAVQKVIIEKGWEAREFIQGATRGFDALKERLDDLSMDDLLTICGTTREAVENFALDVAQADTGVFVWSMGITHHAHGSDTVRGIVNLALLREFVGRPGCGLMPIRGHSGVQGGAEMGAYSTAFPGGLPINEQNARHFSELWGFEVPADTGLTTVEMLEAARRGELDALYCVGGNFLETMPNPAAMHEAIATIPLRVHSDIVLTTQMLVEPADTVFLLPARTRYEQRDGGTETTTERRVVFSPYIPGHDVGDARSEWELLLSLAQAVKPEDYSRVHFSTGDEIRKDIARAVPSYRGITKLHKKGDEFQWGGPLLCMHREFPTEDGRAHFAPVTPPPPKPVEREGERLFLLATRRGKQFNSMVQSARDPLTGAERDHVFLSREDARVLGLHNNQRVVLESEHGRLEGRVFIAEVARGTVQAHWPEANGLIPFGPVDEGGGVPEYNVLVAIKRPLPAPAPA